jgi:N-acetylneuraminic acid mutarotase
VIRYGRSRDQQMIFMRRRIMVAVVALVLLAVVVLFLNRGSKGKPNSVGPTSTTTVRGTSTTTPPQLVVSAAPWQLPAALSREVVLPLGSGLALFGGLGTGNKTNASLIAVDPTNGKNVTLGLLPHPVHDAAGATIGTTLYVFGGGAATEAAFVQAFTFDQNNKSKPSTVGSLPAKRADLATASASGSVFLVGGFDGKVWLPGVLETSDGTTFTTIAQLSTPVRYPAAAALNGKLYVFGGEVSPSQADATTIQQIDLQTMAVTNLSPLPVGLSHAAAVTLNGTIYVLGGRSGGHAIDTISVLNPTTGQLQTVGHLPAARSDMGVATVGQTVYLVGGEGDALKPVTTVVAVRLVPPGTAP